MLKQRIITAVLLLLVLLLTLFAPVPWLFQLLMAAVMACASWEWARLSSFGERAALLWAVVAAAGCACMGYLGWPQSSSDAVRWFLSGVSLLWLLLGPWLLYQGVGVWQRIPRGVRMLAGLCVLCAAWLAAVQLHGRYGVWYLLSVLALIWVADIAAYAFGRTFGKRKLAPAISPGKSWAGAIGGVGSVVAFAAMCAAWLPLASYPADMVRKAGWLALLLVAVVLAVLSIVGDLAESLMKRSMGFKDSSQLLPGHGGVLDRIDALLPVLPVALVLVLWLPD